MTTNVPLLEFQPVPDRPETLLAVTPEGPSYRIVPGPRGVHVWISVPAEPEGGCQVRHLTRTDSPDRFKAVEKCQNHYAAWIAGRRDAAPVPPAS